MSSVSLYIWQPTIGRLKNFVLTYAREKDHGNLETMVEDALSALRFGPNATLKIAPFEAHQCRESNTVLRNLTKKPSLQNLNWERQRMQLKTPRERKTGIGSRDAQASKQADGTLVPTHQR